MRGRYNQFEESDLINIIKNLSRRIEDLEKGAGIGNTSIDNGDLAVANGSFSVGPFPNVYFGPTTFGLDTAIGWELRRSDGTVAFTLSGDSSDNQYWDLRDNAGNVLIADDATADVGLARPYIPVNFTDVTAVPPTATTSLGTFVSLQTARYNKQHPYIRLDILVYASTGATSGELQVVDVTHGVVLTGTSPVVIALGTLSLITVGPLFVSTAHANYIDIDIQARRTAGAGVVGVRTISAYGQQSP